MQVLHFEELPEMERLGDPKDRTKEVYDLGFGYVLKGPYRAKELEESRRLRNALPNHTPKTEFYPLFRNGERKIYAAQEMVEGRHLTADEVVVLGRHRHGNISVAQNASLAFHKSKWMLGGARGVIKDYRTIMDAKPGDPSNANFMLGKSGKYQGRLMWVDV